MHLQDQQVLFPPLHWVSTADYGPTMDGKLLIGSLKEQINEDERKRIFQ